MIGKVCAGRWASMPTLDIETAINNYPGTASPTTKELHSYLRKLYASLLADPAISGITLGAHWDNIQLTDPALFLWLLRWIRLELPGRRLRGSQFRSQVNSTHHYARL